MNRLQAAKAAVELLGKKELERFITDLEQVCVSWSFGLPRAYALENVSVGTCYDTIKFEAMLKFGMEEKFLDDLQREKAAALQELSDKKRLRELAGETDFHLFFRLVDKAQMGVDADFAEDGVRLVIRARVALISAEQRKVDSVAPRTEEVREVPRARLYSDDEIAFLRSREWTSSYRTVMDQFLRIPGIGLYVHENWYPLRVWRVIRERIKHPEQFKGEPWWRWWPSA